MATPVQRTDTRTFSSKFVFKLQQTLRGHVLNLLLPTFKILGRCIVSATVTSHYALLVVALGLM